MQNLGTCGISRLRWRGEEPKENVISRRVVVTGVGLLTSIGDTTEQTWNSLMEARNGISRISSFDPTAFNCQIAGEIKHFDPARFIEKKEIKKMGRFIQMAIAATDDAVHNAGFQVTDEEMAERTGVYIGSGIGGFEVIEREYRNLLEHGPRRISPFFIPAVIINLASGCVSIRVGAKGPNSATATACTTSAHSIGDSFKIIQRDDADVMICGGSEACITPMGIGGFAAMRAMSQRNDDPAHASRPFDRDRDGFVVGEGAGILVLEELEFAKKRGAKILAEIVGYGMSGDAHHLTSPPDDGEGAYRVMRNALRDAKLEPERIDYINAHGTSTPLGDQAETTAIKRAFGDHAKKLAVSSTKSMTGHLLGGAGGIEAGIVVCALQRQVAPPTANLENPDPGCDLDYIPNQARPMKMDYALSNSFGFGGTNGALIFKKFTE
ncbi:MAG TPA: beta-ketoacyl-ACP synthase II [Bryobacteraceae bacterium]|nr:beta-ketoacyl-ACP synthase II [Bryobacteraceae bacterium]